jgi:hypothetical protein
VTRAGQDAKCDDVPARSEVLDPVSQARRESQRDWVLALTEQRSYLLLAVSQRIPQSFDAYRGTEHDIEVSLF